MSVLAANSQMALAVAPRGNLSSSLNKTARQVVPAFLQKLYEMVNDPANHDLIRWSDAGDSFFVLDQERFSSEVLGRWFKHKNFSSFVRQLNMYGFHKIPHLQQGVLRSDSDTEFWNFEHPNFHRGQPDLLCLIQRKKQATQVGEDSAGNLRDLSNPNAPIGNLSAGQILDINSIVNGIAAIKRHQTAISADLNELKTSNQHLWQEAMLARERHKKHQDTINRILKFLAGVFGHTDGSLRKSDDNHSPGRVVPRKSHMLMIGEAPRKKKTVEICEVDDEESGTESVPLDSNVSGYNTPLSSTVPAFMPVDMFSPSSETSPRFSSIEPAVSDIPSPAETVHSVMTPANSIADSKPQEAYLSHSPPSNSLHSPGQSSHTTSTLPSQSTSLTTTSGPSNSNDAMVQAVLAQMMQSPAQMQRLLAALSNQPNYTLPDVNSNSAQQLTPYDPHMDISRGFSAEQFNPAYSASSLALLPPHSNELAPFEPLIDDSERLQKSYKDAAEIDADVNALHTSINSLIESLGFDPSTIGSPDASLDLPPLDDSDHNAAMPAQPSHTDGVAQDFDFDAFLTDLSRTGGVSGGAEEDTDYDGLADKLDLGRVDSSAAQVSGLSSEQLHAFLDEVVSRDDTSPSRGELALQTSKDSRKRKSDAIELEKSEKKSKGVGIDQPGGLKNKRKK